MCDDIPKLNCDIAIIGAGAYGMSLVALIKRDLHRKVAHTECPSQNQTVGGASYW